MFIHVKVKTNQKNESFLKITETRYEVSLKEEAKQNKANVRIIEILKDYFKTFHVKIVFGHHHPNKLFSIIMVDEI